MCGVEVLDWNAVYIKAIPVSIFTAVYFLLAYWD
jgi:hypothetical protein